MGELRVAFCASSIIDPCNSLSASSVTTVLCRRPQVTARRLGRWGIAAGSDCPCVDAAVTHPPGDIVSSRSVHPPAGKLEEFDFILGRLCRR